MRSLYLLQDSDYNYVVIQSVLMFPMHASFVPIIEWLMNCTSRDTFLAVFLYFYSLHGIYFLRTLQVSTKELYIENHIALCDFILYTKNPSNTFIQ